MSQWVFIRPRDVWMFRDSKPFAAGQNFVARSMFPPTPQTMQGVLRTHYLEANAVDFHAYARRQVDQRILETVGGPATHGVPADIGELKIKGPFVAKRTDGKIERWYPAPLDLLWNKQNGTYALLRPADTEPNFYTEPPFSDWRPLFGGGTGFKETDRWMTQQQFDAYLRGDTAGLGTLAEETSLFQFEERPGLSIDPQRRTNAKSLYYRAKFVRPQDGVGLLVHVSPDLFSDAAGPIAIGGESRFGNYSVVSAVDNNVVAQAGRLRVILLTPAYFAEGVFPRDHDWSPWVGSGRLVSYVVGKPQYISGWDVARNEAKPLRHYVPAGSVFFFEDASWQGKPFTERLDGDVDFAAIGYGNAAVGTW